MNKHNLFLVTPIPDIISFLILLLCKKKMSNLSMKLAL